MTKGRDIINALKGKEDFDIELDIKYFGRSVTTSNGEIGFDFIDDYKKGFMILNASTLNYGYAFDDGKEKEVKKKSRK